MLRGRSRIVLLALMLPLALGVASCKKNYIKDVDPATPGQVRSLGPESQDIIALSDAMIRSLDEAQVFQQMENAPVIAVLPMRNNTRYNWNTEVASVRLKTELAKRAKGRYHFVSRDVLPDILAEREAKRTGKVDYDPSLRTTAPAGADYFLIGSANGLANVSTRGQSDFITYDFRLIDSETGLDVWQDLFDTKKEGKDDLIYR